MGYSYGNRGLSGSRLYIAVAAWLILVLVGGFCTWYGWFGPGSQSGEPTDEPEVTATAVAAEAAPPTTEATVAPTTPATVPVVLPTVSPGEEVFGYGIAANGTGGGDVNFMMGQVSSLGLGWVKQQVRWRYFEGNPGEMDWSGFDWVVDAANEQGFKVLFSVVDAPHWSRTYFDENPEGAPPDDLTVLADFMGSLVDRYQGRIHAIEVWNEQNLDREWDTAEGVSPERYVEMLRLAYQAIKSRDPNIIVVSGALSPVGASATDPNNPARVIYMDDFQYFQKFPAIRRPKTCTMNFALSPKSRRSSWI